MFLWSGKKNGTLEVAQLVNTLGFREKQTIHEISQLPDNASYTFDEDECSSKVLKTTFRHKVVSLEYTKFQAKDTLI